MNNETLAQSYMKKAHDRLDVLELLERKGAWSDVIRESQEIVELALKGMLRFVGIEPPKIPPSGGSDGLGPRSLTCGRGVSILLLG